MKEINLLIKMLIVKYQNMCFKGKDEIINDLKLLDELINLEV